MPARLLKMLFNVIVEPFPRMVLVVASGRFARKLVRFVKNISSLKIP